MKNRQLLSLAALIILMTMFVNSIRPQIAAGGQFSLEQSVVAGGGASKTAGGQFSLDGTIGQAAAGNESVNSPFTATSGFWNFTPSAPNGLSYEADVASRPNGNSLIQSNDVVMIRSFLTNCNSIDTSTNEFQRADSAPFNTKGDGLIQSNDVVQVRRYVNNSDAPQLAGGPTAGCPGQPANIGEQASAKAPEIAAPNGALRQVRVESATASAGSTVTVNIRVEPNGDESEYAFVLNYQAPMSAPVVSNGTAGSLLRDCNVGVAGQVNCSVGGFPNDKPGSSNSGIGEIGFGSNQILLKVTFQVAANAVVGSTTPLSLTGVNASNDAAALLPIAKQNGVVTITGPTAAMVSVGGRVMTTDGRGILNARVTMTSSSGETQTVISTVSGYFLFTNVPAGGTYIFSPIAKHYQFSQPSQVRAISEDTDDINFVAVSKRQRAEGFVIY
jgi:hypothetical protein